jgi:protein phosphatase
MNTLKLRVGFVTDTGRARERNEDALALYMPYEGDERVGPLDGLFVVADGMGGHDAGDQASRFVADSVANALTRGQSTPEGEEDVPTADVIAEWLRRALRRIDRELRKQVKEVGLPNQAGSTATVAAVLGEVIHFAHVGDSRAYRMRGGELHQLTHDHSWVADQVRAGLLSEEEAATHPKRHMLTHCLGIGQAPKVDVLAHAIEPGDRFLLSSDGMHGVVPDRMIERVLADEPEPQVAAKRLAAIANEAGGPDNITAIVIDASAAAPPVADIEGDTAAPDVTTPDSAAVPAGAGVTDPAAPAVSAKAAGETRVAETAVSSGATGPGDTVAGEPAARSDDAATDEADSPAPAARSNLASRAVLVAGVLLIAGAATFGAWHYLGAQSHGDAQEAADSTAIPTAAPDTLSPAPVVTPDPVVPAGANGVGTEPADTVSRVPEPDPDTLDTGARS